MRLGRRQESALRLLRELGQKGLPYANPYVQERVLDSLHRRGLATFSKKHSTAHGFEVTYVFATEER